METVFFVPFSRPRRGVRLRCFSRSPRHPAGARAQPGPYAASSQRRSHEVAKASVRAASRLRRDYRRGWQPYLGRAAGQRLGRQGVAGTPLCCRRPALHRGRGSQRLRLAAGRGGAELRSSLPADRALKKNSAACLRWSYFPKAGPCSPQRSGKLRPTWGANGWWTR